MIRYINTYNTNDNVILGKESGHIIMIRNLN